jgi:hypothetical protein
MTPKRSPEHIPNVCEPDPKAARHVLAWWAVFDRKPRK